MYTAIRQHDGGGQTPDDLARASRTLANRLSASAGFIAYLLMETPGGYASIAIFEDQASLAAAEAALAGCASAGPATPWASLAQPLAGEVLAQKGL